uniref:Uncharacterized protein n=1 Tax=Utricularia reniformis TaxID=192314 RepID=A0A1Y0B4A1_9LAMI|nr:hypothetical protein AEK19_MT1996 [Utricularia reniformis]ART32159.1 hypothetical protein AEK19_MT1996 [Utricularia reniformis]
MDSPSILSTRDSRMEYARNDDRRISLLLEFHERGAELNNSSSRNSGLLHSNSAQLGKNKREFKERVKLRILLLDRLTSPLFTSYLLTGAHLTTALAGIGSEELTTILASGEITPRLNGSEDLTTTILLSLASLADLSVGRL